MEQYYALRRTGALSGHDALVRGERTVAGAAVPSTGLRFEELRAAVAEVRVTPGHGLAHCRAHCRAHCCPIHY